jgi:hypothetical protein
LEEVVGLKKEKRLARAVSLSKVRKKQEMEQEWLKFASKI